MKRKKILLILISLLIIHLSMLGQIQVGLMAGPQFSTREYKFGSAHNGLIASMNAGVISLIPLSKTFLLQAIPGYSGKGVIIKDFTFNDALGNDMGRGNINILLHYIELRTPLNYLLPISPNSIAFAGVGPYFSYAVGGFQKIKNNDFFAPYLDKKLDFEDEYNRFEFGITGNVGFQLMEKWLLGIYTDLGISGVFKTAGRNTHHRSLSLTLGYLFYKQKKDRKEK